MLSFAIKNIQSLIKEYKAIFILFFSVCSLVAASLVYLHAFNVNLLAEGNRVSKENRTYKISGYMEIEAIEDIVEKIQMGLAENEMQSILLHTDDGVDLEGIPARIAIVYGDLDTSQIALECGSAELEKDKKEILLNDIFFMENQFQKLIHDKLQVNGEDFTLKAIGHIGTPNIDAIITMTGMEAVEVEITGVDIVFENRLNKAQLQQVKDILGEQYGIKEPPAYKTTFSRQFFNRFLLIFALILMATINIMGLYRYIVLRRNREFFIYKIYGISSQKLSVMLILETLIFITIGFGFGVILFLVIRYFGTKWMHVSVDISIFLQTYLLELLCAVIAIVPVLYRIRKNAVVSEYAKEDRQ